MITKEMLDRINWLARKQRTTGLTGKEKEEQHNLRQKYLQCIRAQVVDALDSAGIKPKAGEHSDCSCPTCKGDKKVH
ncbi:MAG: DUF896 domain-containing protein [Actinobacteria bacterium]|nr:DUF896 domain-containing protein [Actinomycetota bacterium]